MGSVVRKITRPVKKAVKSVAKVAKSDVGKAALAAAGLYYLGGGALGPFQRTGFQATGFRFGNIPGVTGIQNVLLGTPGDTGGRVAGTGLFDKFGLSSLGDTFFGTPGKTFKSIAGISALSGLLAAKDQKSEEEIANMSTEERNEYVAKLRAAYTANLARGFPGIGSVPYAMAAEGGRIGYAEGSKDKSGIMMVSNEYNERLLESLFEQFLEEGFSEVEAARKAREAFQDLPGLAKGGMPTGVMRTNAAGIKERDYRDEGGFVPVGIKEKADDVPAMLSKNEFVMTADAVRGAGAGSIEKGAQKMYDTMKKLEDKVA